MPDTLIIRDLAVECRLGVFDWEQEKPQTVWVDLELAIDAARAARRDDVRDAVDYAKLVELVRASAGRRSFRLLETLAEAIASRLLSESRTGWVLVRVKKRSLPGIDYAAVEIERRRARVGRRSEPRVRTTARAR